MGHKGSFASLIEMLDPTRVPDPEKLQREISTDLVIGRFRSIARGGDAIKKKVKEARGKGRPLPGGRARRKMRTSCIARSRLELDKKACRKRQGMDLFLTTPLAQAIFSAQ